jgi:hypothetical protein
VSIFKRVDKHLFIFLAHKEGSGRCREKAMLRVGPKPKFTVSFAIFVASYVIVSISSGVALWRMPKPAPGWPHTTGTNAVLPDLGFDTVPYFGHLLCATKSIFIGLPTLILVVYMSSTALLALCSRSRSEIIMRFMLVESALLLLRSISITLTALTNPDPRCANCQYGCPGNIFDAIKMTLRRFPFWSCGDLVFSGHTVEFTLSALVWLSYCKIRFLRFSAACTAIVGVTSLIGCRYHYSVDIFIAFVLSYLVWSAYPFLLNLSDGSAPLLFRAAARCVRWLNGCHPPSAYSAAHDHERQPLVAAAIRPEIWI